MSQPEPEVTASVGIVTDDADELLAFYRSGLGFALESSSELPQGTVHRLRREAARCKLYVPLQAPRRDARPEPWHARVGMAYAALQVPDVVSAVDTARAAGAEVLHPPTAHRPGAAYALIRDPQGNVWELLQDSTARSGPEPRGD